MISRAFYRSLATATKSTKPPVQLFGLDGTYANALYSATIQQSDMAQTYRALEKVENVIKGDPQLEGALTNPSLTKDDRVSIAKAVSDNLKLDKTTANFLIVLAENNRLGSFSSIFQKFGLLNDAYNGVVEAKVTSAKPLESKILKRLQTSIGKSSFVGEGQTLKLTNHVNPEILGGLVVEVGDRTVDVSIANKVARLNQTLKDNL
ncbi:ATP5 ATP synthase subunit 5 [Candida maltosa Xu316]|uniref:ATP synthase subunit 5, mitochondrial n=1 Tax=Candida maltosa (strain Xu316) TaxID=1245528 RepID=M3HDN1_CANMX|nr:ATP synthase [Candida maltosa Xu316]